MEAVRKIVKANELASVIDLPWASNDAQVELIVLSMSINNIPHGKPEKSLKGCLKEYANPSLMEHEKEAWEINVRDKHGNI